MRNENATNKTSYVQRMTIIEMALRAQERIEREQHAELRKKLADALAGASFVSDNLLPEDDIGYINLVLQIAFAMMTGLRSNEVLDMISDTIYPPPETGR